MTEHEIIRIPSVGQSGREELIQLCYNIRIDVFHREQGFPLDTEIDELSILSLSRDNGLFPILRFVD